MALGARAAVADRRGPELLAGAGPESLDIGGDCGITPRRRILGDKRERAGAAPVAGDLLACGLGGAQGRVERQIDDPIK